MSERMRIGSLFSGIGGLELGLEQSGLGYTTWQVEADAFCRSVLARHWPRVKRYEDVREVGRHNLEAVELICGGFPCQDISVAGRGAGLAGARSGLWYEFLRVVEELRPAWVVVENVGHGSSRWVDGARQDLELEGYETLPVPLAAKHCGAPHIRSRVFVVAHAEREQLRELEQRVPARRAHRIRYEGEAELVDPREARRWQPLPELCRSDDGVPRELDRARLRALGNAVVPRVAEVVGHVVSQWHAQIVDER